LTLLYVHGWKHDASPTDTDLIAFTKLIQTLQTKYDGKKQLLGVYVSWDASTGLGILDNFSFWSKKSIADRISESAVVTKIIATIGALRKIDDQRLDQFIAIGHSFGARIAFTATSQSLAIEASRKHPAGPMGQYGIISGSADAVILLNPAFEASLYTALDSFCRVEETFAAGQPPLLISIATDNDRATGGAFPLGQWIGMYRAPLEEITLGNYQPYKTHSLLRKDSAQCPQNDSKSASLTQHFRALGLCLVRDPPTADDAKNNKVRCPYNPFLVAGTNKEIINGHNGIWNELFSNWLSEFITALTDIACARLHCLLQ
jgi:pimeloyl-ACP methyl ester carboxylesterase